MTRLLPLPETPSRLRWWARLLVSGLALALLLSQSLGQLHAIKHSALACTQHAVGAHESQQSHQAHHDGGFLEQLFSSHSSSTDCRLYDQLRDSYVMPAVALMALPVVLPSFAVAVFQGEALARWAALFDARGPPLTF